MDIICKIDWQTMHIKFAMNRPHIMEKSLSSLNIDWEGFLRCSYRLYLMTKDTEDIQSRKGLLIEIMVGLISSVMMDGLCLRCRHFQSHSLCEICTKKFKWWMNLFVGMDSWAIPSVERSVARWNENRWEFLHSTTPWRIFDSPSIQTRTPFVLFFDSVLSRTSSKASVSLFHRFSRDLQCDGGSDKPRGERRYSIPINRTISFREGMSRPQFCPDVFTLGFSNI